MNLPRRRKRPIEIDRNNTSAASQQVCRRLQRIESNYAELDRVLAEVESMLEADPTLQELAASSESGSRRVRRRPKPR